VLVLLVAWKSFAITSGLAMRQHTGNIVQNPKGQLVHELCKSTSQKMLFIGKVKNNSEHKKKRVRQEKDKSLRKR
jgi:hypothetical protein